MLAYAIITTHTKQFSRLGVQDEDECAHFASHSPAKWPVLVKQLISHASWPPRTQTSSLAWTSRMSARAAKTRLSFMLLRMDLRAGLEDGGGMKEPVGR